MEASGESGRRRARRGAQTLVFVHLLLLLRAAADCPKPDEPENTALSTAALLLNTFRDGTDVMLECGNGYETDSGSGLITCMDDRWTEPDLICKKKDCGPLTPEPHMTFDLSGGTLFGAKVKVSCDKGYHISGSSYRQCFNSGWYGRGRCEIDTCEKVAEILNGQIIWDSEARPEYGEVVRIACDEGFRMVGQDALTCSESGQYDAELPTCEGETTEDSIKPDMSTAAPATTQPGNGPTTRTTGETTEDRIKPDMSTAAPAATQPGNGPTTRTTGGRIMITTAAKTDPSTPPPLAPGGRVIPPEEEGAPPAVTSTTSSQGNNGVPVDTTRDNGYLPVIICVVCVSLATCMAVLFIHKYIMRKKGLTFRAASIRRRASVIPDRRADRL